jgi:hypothetical protein
VTSPSDAPALGLDHVVLGVRGLDASAVELSAVLGRGPSWRGRHPTYGTENVLYRLDNAYLELLAPDATANVSTPWTDGLRAFLDSHGDGLFALAFSTPNVERTAELLQARGLPVETPAAGEGVDLISGAQRRWSNARIPVEASRGTPAFFIEHRSPADALPDAPYLTGRDAAVVSVLGLSIESGDVEGARRFWHETVGLPETAFADGRRFGVNDAALLLFPGAGEGSQPDRWYSLVLGVSNISSIADRLDGDRITFQQGDYREGYGLRLDAVGADVLLTGSL